MATKNPHDGPPTEPNRRPSRSGTHIQRKAIGLTLALTAILALAVPAGHQVAELFSPASPGPSPQQELVRTVLKDRALLFEARYTVSISSLHVNVGSITEVNAYVCGPKAAKDMDCPLPAEEPSPSLSRKPQQGTPTVRPGAAGLLKAGGRIKADLIADSKTVKVTLKSPNRTLPVVGRKDRAHWSWDVQALKPGTHHLTLTLTLLKGNTADPLVADAPSLQMDLIADQTIGYRAKEAENHLVTLAIPLAAVLSGLGAIGGGFWFTRRKSRNHGESELTQSEAENEN
ncbi:hypothetical protein AB0H37_24745 [Actinomadura sp. NPDC023710]|uniref:hypothetical protein n=1 Tax=Actinomadura sp. NPDC023710 TaxID=3158219 RepID=UPI0033E9CA5A